MIYPSDMETPDFTKYNSTISPSGDGSTSEPIPMYSQYQVKMLILAAFQYLQDCQYKNVMYEPRLFFEYYNLNK